MDVEIAILSHSPVLRTGLAHLLDCQSMTVVSVTNDVTKLRFRSLDRERGNCILLVDGFTADELRHADLRRCHPAARLVLLADQFDREAVAEAMSEGFDGYILKEMSPEALVASLQLIALGEKVIPAEMATPALACDRLSARLAELPRTILSEREISVLRLLAGGECNKLIARKLGIREATVKVHVKAALRKLGVANRTQAAIWAFRNGLGEEREAFNRAAVEDPIRSEDFDCAEIGHYGPPLPRPDLSVHETQEAFRVGVSASKDPFGAGSKPMRPRPKRWYVAAE